MIGSLFLTAYLGWKSPEKRGRKVAANVPTYQEVLAEVNRRMDMMQQPRQLPKPAGLSAADVMAEFERRTAKNG